MKKIRVLVDFDYTKFGTGLKRGEIVDVHEKTAFGVFGNYPITFEHGVELGFIEWVDEESGHK